MKFRDRGGCRTAVGGHAHHTPQRGTEERRIGSEGDDPASGGSAGGVDAGVAEVGVVVLHAGRPTSTKTTNVHKRVDGMELTDDQRTGR